MISIKFRIKLICIIITLKLRPFNDTAPTQIEANHFATEGGATIRRNTGSLKFTETINQ